MMNTIYAALRAKLAADAALITELGGTAIFAMEAPDNANLPYVVMTYQAGGNTNTDGMIPVDVDVAIQCLATTPQKSTAAAARVYAALHEQPLGGTVIRFYRLQRRAILDYVEYEDRLRIYHAGGVYRVRGTTA